MLLTFTLLVAIVIPGCGSKDESTSSTSSTSSTTTSTTTPVAPYTQKEFDDVLVGMQGIMGNASYVTAESHFVFAVQIAFVTVDFRTISASDFSFICPTTIDDCDGLGAGEFFYPI